ncbi:Altered inheritance of mitochondria protein 6 [Xylographa pallens]|nr:Altered inheritance of mitochondria protein 6 [Xylographa pallens]
MAVRTSEDSNDSGNTLLLDDNLLDRSSDFIAHVPAPVRRHHNERDRTSWQLPAWTGVLGLFVSKSNRSKFLNNRQDDLCVQCERRSPRRKSRAWWGLVSFVAILTVLGLVQLLSIVAGLLSRFSPGKIPDFLDFWDRKGQPGYRLGAWPTDFTRDIRPIACHSHNDYWRTVPLYSALSAGCISVEADVWLFDEELFVGHSTSSLTRNRTLKALYIDPLMEILSKQNPVTEFHPNSNASLNGVFDTDPTQTLTLLIDFKTAGSATWPYVVKALEPLRSANYLTYHNGTILTPGPITIVGTGNTPLSHVTSNSTNPSHDIFFDAPLSEMWESPTTSDPDPGPSLRQGEDSAQEDSKLSHTSKRHKSPSTYHKEPSKALEERIATGNTPVLPQPDIYSPENSYYASVAFVKAIGRMWRMRLSEQQMALIRGHIRGAHRRGLKVRYWDLPDWPIGLRNYVWDVLMREGVDVLNVDGLTAASKWDWGNGEKG